MERSLLALAPAIRLYEGGVAVKCGVAVGC
jgi:hypothetical protein